MMTCERAAIRLDQVTSEVQNTAESGGRRNCLQTHVVLAFLGDTYMSTRSSQCHEPSGTRLNQESSQCRLHDVCQQTFLIVASLTWTVTRAQATQPYLQQCFLKQMMCFV